MQRPSLFKFKEHTLEFQEMSQGKKKMLCFNGYGKVAKDFEVYHDFFAKDIQAVVLHLPFHGNGDWYLQEKKANKQHNELLEAFFKHLKWENEELHLFAYSIGARYTFALTALFPSKIKSVYLLAPDGIYPNFISHYATFNKYGKKLMNGFISHAGFIIFILKFLNYFKILSDNDFAFFMRKIKTKEDRVMLQKVWKEVYTTTPNFKEILAHPIFNKIEWHIFLGKDDKVFPYGRMKKLIPQKKNISIYSWQSGHAMLKESIGYKLSLTEIKITGQ